MIDGLDELEGKLELLARESGTIGKKAARNAIKKFRRERSICARSMRANCETASARE